MELQQQHCKERHPIIEGYQVHMNGDKDQQKSGHKIVMDNKGQQTDDMKGREQSIESLEECKKKTAK